MTFRLKPSSKRKSTAAYRFKLTLEKRAKYLNIYMPPSERWFWQNWEERGFKHPNDKPNVPKKFYIFDVLNEKFKYAIEIDGSYHDIPAQIKRDNSKTLFLYKKGYKCFRIKAFDKQDFDNTAEDILAYREKRRNAEAFKT